jgi:hypothetical protein
MNGIPPLPQYAFMAWCSVKAQGQLYLYLYHIMKAYWRVEVWLQAFLTSELDGDKR